jgi:hypothetical protein
MINDAIIYLETNCTLASIKYVNNCRVKKDINGTEREPLTIH